MEWIGINGHGKKTIGAVGFIGNDAVAVAAFFDDADGNMDGEVSAGEWIGSKLLLNIKGRAVAQVAMQARVDPDILERDASFLYMASNIYMNFARGLVAQGIYSAYFAPGVRMTGRAVAGAITNNMVKQLVIRKGFEKAAKEAFSSLVR